MLQVRVILRKVRNKAAGSLGEPMTHAVADACMQQLYMHFDVQLVVHVSGCNLLSSPDMA